MAPATPSSLTPLISNNTQNIDQSRVKPLKWENITPQSFTDAPNNSCTNKLQLIRNVADFMIERKTTTYSDALRMAREISVRFPKAFEKHTWKNGEKTIYSDGIDSLRSRIYERLKYVLLLVIKNSYNTHCLLMHLYSIISIFLGL